MYFHNAPSLFTTDCFDSRCRWADKDDSGFSPILVFLSDNERDYVHKWTMELDSEHLPLCVWLTRYSDSALSIIDSFFI